MWRGDIGNELRVNWFRRGRRNRRHQRWPAALQCDRMLLRENMSTVTCTTITNDSRLYGCAPSVIQTPSITFGGSESFFWKFLPPAAARKRSQMLKPMVDALPCSSRYSRRDTPPPGGGFANSRYALAPGCSFVCASISAVQALRCEHLFCLLLAPDEVGTVAQNRI